MPFLDRAPSSRRNAEPAALSEPSVVDPGGSSLPEEPHGRYEAEAVLGEGGMGEVRLCRDVRIGREVAMKMMLAGQRVDRVGAQRFLREARVQGQLEHPSIVPVYDLGSSDDGGSTSR